MTLHCPLERTRLHPQHFGGTCQRQQPRSADPGSMRSIMTWSLIAREPDGRFGVAIASRFFAVGALCVHTRAGAGALCTQALMNPLYGHQGLEALNRGLSAQAVVDQLTRADAGAAQRQLHVWGMEGPGAVHTGSQCVAWCGHQVGENFSVAGNMLAGPEVIQATARAFEANRGQPLAQRLIVAMAAGEAAGGDKRGNGRRMGKSP